MKKKHFRLFDPLLLIFIYLLLTSYTLIRTDKQINYNAPHYIGEKYGGGIIFYLYDNGQHGLIAAPEDQSTSMRWYYGANINTLATADGLGAGRANTSIIISSQGYGDGSMYAARLCNGYSVNDGVTTYGDWYLPSKYELNLLYLKKSAVSGIANEAYWSSSEFYNGYSWSQDFSNGFQSSFKKDGEANVRAIRGF